MATPAQKHTRLGRYEVIRHLASGGMAEIYLAEGVGEKVVVKVISEERAQDQKFIHMFLDEARVASTLHHPNIAQMLEVGRHGDTYFFAMEYIDGVTARELLERAVAIGARIPLAACLKIITSVAAGLHHAHERKGGTGVQLQIVHRDVTPSNIMLGNDGTVKLLDFGIAQAEGRAAETQSGTIKGKFAYMSPEQCRGKAVDRRTDVFALGIVLYELTTQRRAFRTDSDFDTMDRIVRGRLLKPTQIDARYPRELEQILMYAMATEPENRYQSAADFGHAVDEFARRTGNVATPDDLAAMLHELFGTTDVEVQAAPEGTASDVEMSISPGIAATLDLGVSTTQRDDEDAADAASTQRRIRSPIARALEQAAADAADTGAFAPQHTGPMPVMSTVRPTGPLEVAPMPPSVMESGANPRVVVTPPSQNRRPPSQSLPPGQNPVARTILGMRPAPSMPPGTGSNPAMPMPPPGSGSNPAMPMPPPGSKSNPAMQIPPPGSGSNPNMAMPPSASGSNPSAPLVDSGRRPVMVPMLPAAAPAIEGTGTSAVQEAPRHRTGLVLAIVAVVLVAAGIAAMILLTA